MSRPGTPKRGRKIGPPAEAFKAPAARGAASIDAGSPSLLVHRTDWGRTAGLSFQNPLTGKFGRSMNDALGYQEALSYADYRGRYERGGIAERIVEAYPKATWGGEIYFQESPDPNEYTPFEEAADDLFERLGAWSKFERADILAGLGDFSILLIGATGELETPLSKVSSPDEILFLTPAPQNTAKIESLVRDKKSVRYGAPEFYGVMLGADNESTRVHWTRILHVAEGVLENEIYGKPRLRAVWNRLEDLDKILGGGAEATWKRVDPGLQIDIDPEIELSADEEDSLDAELDEYHHGFRRHIRTRGGKITPLAANVAAFGSNATSIMEQISGTSGIPRRILTGSERGELSSIQDRDNWSDRVTERRRQFAGPLVRSLVERFISIGALPKPAAKYTAVWPEIEELNSAQKATVAVALANANQAQFNADGRILLEPDEIRARVFGMSPLNKEPFDMVDPVAQAQIEADLVAQENTLPTENQDMTADTTAAAALDISGGTVEFVSATSADETTWDAVERAAEAHVAPVRRAFVKLWDDASKLISARSAQFELAVTQKNRVGAQRIAVDAIREAEVANVENIHRQIDRAFYAGGAATLQAAKSRGSFYDPKLSSVIGAAEGDVPPASALPIVPAIPPVVESLAITMVFNAVNPRAILYGRFRSSSLITQVNEETINAIRMLIARGISEGIKPRNLRLLIEKEVGLRTDQVRALENFTARGATEAQTKRYARKLLRDRASLIASTEAARAASEGQREVWLQAVEDGWLPADQMRVWLVVNDEKLRPEHRAMSGQIRGLQEKFVKPGGSRIEPGSEPNCRCSSALASSTEIERYRRKVRLEHPDNPELAQ